MVGEWGVVEVSKGTVMVKARVCMLGNIPGVNVCVCVMGRERGSREAHTWGIGGKINFCARLKLFRAGSLGLSQTFKEVCLSDLSTPF